MYIDEYILQHPEKLPKGRELMEFSAECETYIDHAKDLVPYDDPAYVSKVFDICITTCTPLDPDLIKTCEYHDKILSENTSEKQDAEKCTSCTKCKYLSYYDMYDCWRYEDTHGEEIDEGFYCVLLDKYITDYYNDKTCKGIIIPEWCPKNKN